MTTSILETLLRKDGSSQTVPILRLVNGPYVTCREQVLQIPEGSQRLVVFVALRRGTVDRRQVAGSLWPDGDDDRAAGNLRSSLWRLKRSKVDIMSADKRRLWLAPDVRVDVHLLTAWSSRLLQGKAESSDLCLSSAEAILMDLLPGWYEEWVMVERELMRQRILHALEALARILIGLGRNAEAVDIATATVAAEPLRESAQRVLLEAHMSEGNIAEAWRSYQIYRELIARELGVGVSDDLLSLIARGRPVCRDMHATRRPMHSDGAPFPEGPRHTARGPGPRSE